MRGGRKTVVASTSNHGKFSISSNEITSAFKFVLSARDYCLIIVISSKTQYTVKLVLHAFPMTVDVTYNLNYFSMFW